MKLIYFLILYITFTNCKKHEDLEGKEFEKVDKSIFDLEFFEDKEDIILTMKSTDYVPVDANWYTEDKKFEIETLFINGYEFSYWMQENVTDVAELDNFLMNLDKHVFVFEIEKQKFDDKYNDLECVLIVVNKKDWQKMMTEFFIKKKSISSTDFKRLEKLEAEFTRNFEPFMISYGIKFANNSDKMPNFNDYEVVIYKNKSKKDSFKANASIKKTEICFLIQTVLIILIFGVLIVALRYSLSKS